jgi:hypothetical protein
VMATGAFERICGTSAELSRSHANSRGCVYARSSCVEPIGAFLVIAFFEGIPVDNPDHPGTRKFDDAAVFKLGQRAAHGLDRNSEIVGDIVARDGERDAIEDRGTAAFPFPE